MSGLVTADEINRWADMATAPTLLPELLTRLVYATAYERLREARFATGKGTGLGGWDGRTVTEGHGLLVPEGIAVWELGTQVNPGAKAEKDYNVRKQNTFGVEPSTVTYVAVTARSWECDTWQGNRRDEGFWKDVRVFDAQGLYTWLLASPVVHRWLSSQIGIDTLPLGVLGVEEWWEEWSESARVTLPTKLVHAGHLQDAERLRRRLVDRAPDMVGVRAESRNEALAFIVSTVMAAPQKNDYFFGDELELAARALIVESQESFRELARTKLPLILIPTFDDHDVIDWAARSHIVKLPFGPADRDAEVFLDIGPVDPQEVEAVLRDMGLEDQEAKDLAVASNGSLLALRRALQKHRNPGGLPWAGPDAGLRLAPVALVNRWDEGRSGDCNVVAEVSQRSYRDVQAMLTPQLYSWEPPVSKTGTIWRLRNAWDAWKLLHRYLTDTDLVAFAAQAIGVLRIPDPRFELPPALRYAGAAYGKVPAHSQDLRDGLVETVAILGAVGGDTTFDSTMSAQAWATHIVGAVLDNVSWETWASLGRLLPALAEASPDAFLRALDRGLKGDAPLGPLLDSNGTDVFGEAYHVGLVRGLERLTWSPNHLSRAVLALARLAELDPGGRTYPRPVGILVAVLSPRTRPKTITTEASVAVLDLMRERHPDAAWSAMLAGVSQSSAEHVLDSSEPEFRRWAREADG